MVTNLISNLQFKSQANDQVNNEQIKHHRQIFKVNENISREKSEAWKDSTAPLIHEPCWVAAAQTVDS